ncbi:hypothetical protein D9756_010844 [Leucocoprinus leucothites]|uniref:Uncharacterized protein n=1 Tax=Leucocoprinus leucothites TaxID=201217 RepID=A0A8H5CS46_9AGAR|nr:hypothetical protein D9756_010844 [Leucoagaricus leucothites]
MPEAPRFNITGSTVTYVAGNQTNYNYGDRSPLPRHDPPTNYVTEESQPQPSTEETPGENGSRSEFYAGPQPPQHPTGRRPASSQQPLSQSQLGHGLHQNTPPPSTATNSPVALQTTPIPAPPLFNRHGSPRSPPSARSPPPPWAAPSSIASTPQATVSESFHPHPTSYTGMPMQAQTPFPPSFLANRSWQGPHENRPNQGFDAAEGIEHMNGYHATEGGQYVNNYRSNGTAQPPLPPRQQPPYEHSTPYYHTTSPQASAAQRSQSQAYTPHNPPYNPYMPLHGQHDPRAQNNQGSATRPFPAQPEHNYRRTPDQ